MSHSLLRGRDLNSSDSSDSVIFMLNISLSHQSKVNLVLPLTRLNSSDITSVRRGQVFLTNEGIKLKDVLFLRTW